ncbi:MAG: hypothetical protein MUP81_02635 [Dehalococcoidia bacterium]|nr:hypothetical protein [Dehalococcoidia bacterium]
MEMMKIRPIYWIALALVLALTVAVCDGLRLRDKYSIAIGKYQEALKAVNALNVEKDKTIADAQKQITLQTAKIAELLGNAGKPSPSEIEKDKVIVALKQKNAALAAAGDYKAAYEGAQVEIQAWAEKFTLAEERHKMELFDLNAAWQGKFNAQAVISESWKARFEGEVRLRTLAEKGWKASERKLKWTRIIGNVKTGLILAAIAAVGYEELRGKVK